MPTPLKKALIFETAFSRYTLTEQLGLGGAGIVYGGTSHEGIAVAVKVLAGNNLSSDKRKRFKNETAFLLRTRSPNIVLVQDYGISPDGHPFYVMKRYDESLRSVMDAGLNPEQLLKIYAKALDGIEAAHLLNVVHRDVKPENMLWLRATQELAISDFGIANFTEEEMATLVDTYGDLSDKRPILDWMRAIRENAIVYVGLDALSDHEVASAVGNSMFADLKSVAGALYKFGDTQGLAST